MTVLHINTGHSDIGRDDCNQTRVDSALLRQARFPQRCGILFHQVRRKTANPNKIRNAEIWAQTEQTLGGRLRRLRVPTAGATGDDKSDSRNELRIDVSGAPRCFASIVIA